MYGCQCTIAYSGSITYWYRGIDGWKEDILHIKMDLDVNSVDKLGPVSQN